jgi:hypothetical protein
MGTGPFDLTVATAQSSASAAVTGTGPANVTSMTASGSALGTLASSYSAGARAASFSVFTVTTNTQVSFSALANVEASTLIGPQADFESASAFAGLLAEGFPPGGSGFQSSQDSLFVFGRGNQSASRANSLVVSFGNSTGNDIEVVLFRGVTLDGFSGVVPEPETYAMMVAGAGAPRFHAPTPECSSIPLRIVIDPLPLPPFPRRQRAGTTASRCTSTAPTGTRAIRCASSCAPSTTAPALSAALPARAQHAGAGLAACALRSNDQPLVRNPRRHLGHRAANHRRVDPPEAPAAL